IGFTEAEVRSICEEGGLSFENMRAWYDGYSAGTEHSIYNPYSVMRAVKDRAFRSYWKKTSAAEALKTYIDMDEDGLQDVIARLIAGESAEVDTDAFQNDLTTFTSRDDVLTLMIHLGYLAYEEDGDAYGEDGGDTPAGFVRIPNREVRLEFGNILRKAKHKELIQLVRDSDQLLKDTLEGREEAVAGAFSRIRETEYAPAYYNNEQALRYIIKFAYISSVDQYARLEELPTGRGLADIVFVPKKRSVLPAMIIELKWSKSAEGAINQIYEKKYPSALKGYGGSIVLVGINYDQKTKEHSCRIETV
ncbi:MAG: PD-(D/E)XK nuclease domain-containing protein, partial [Lachnospiraceae bacterium]|nr:PD-(D/E)XK nuclease domain-containing protein [Lachnospiraceae bacterium]